MARPPKSNDKRRPAQTAGAGKTGKIPGIIHGEVPPREILLEFIQDNPDRANKRGNAAPTTLPRPRAFTQRAHRQDQQ